MSGERGNGVRVVAVGSPHGDDRAGWVVADRLRRDGVRAVTAAEPLGLLDHLDDCGRLVVVDACRGGAEPGTIVRVEWPAWSAVAGGGPDDAGASTHGFGVAEALTLAEALGRLPPRVVLFGVEAGPCEPGDGLSPAVAAALPELCRRIRDEAENSGSGGSGSCAPTAAGRENA